MKKIKMFEGVRVCCDGETHYYKDLEVLKVYDFQGMDTEVVRNMFIAYPDPIGDAKFSMKIVGENEVKEKNIEWEDVDDND